jgi:hypothetical protein
VREISARLAQFALEGDALGGLDFKVVPQA